MKKLLVNSLIVVLFCSYIVPIEAMMLTTSKQQQLTKARQQQRLARQQLMAEKEQQGLAQEPTVEESQISMDEPIVVSQPSWLSRGWEAARKGAVSAKQQVADLISAGQQQALLTQQHVSNVFAEVKSWRWNRIVAVLTAIALTFGFVITVYNNDGNLVETFGDKSFFAAIGPLVGMTVQYFVNDFNQTVALLINRANELTKEPERAIEGLKREYEKEIKGTSKDTLVMEACYNAAIKYFEEIIQLQKNIMLAEVEKKSPEGYKEQEKLLSTEEFKSNILNVPTRGSKEAVEQAKRSVAEKKAAEEKVNEIVSWVESYFPNNISNQISYLEGLRSAKDTPSGFPVEVKNAKTAIEKAIDYLYLESLR